MKATKLISRLEELVAEHGDLDIVVYADHGQTSERAGVASAVWTCEAEGSSLDTLDLDDVEPEDIGYYEDNATKFIEIS